MDNNLNLINEFLDYKNDIRMCSNNTILAYRNDLNQYLEFLNKHKVNLLKTESKHIQYYLGEIGKTHISSNSMARKLASIKSLYRYLANNKIIPINISRLIKTPRIPKRLPNFLSIKEIKSLLDYPYGDSYKDLRDRLVLELFYSTGIRISELAQIKIKDIDLSNKLIKIKGKGNKERFVIFGSCIVPILNKYIKERFVKEKNEENDSY